MSERALVLSADTWGMTDEKTGQLINGVSCWYVNDYRDDTDDSFGLKPTKISATPEIYAELKKVRLPALFDLDFGSRPGAQGKATLTLTRATYVRSVNFFVSTEKAAPEKVAA